MVLGGARGGELRLEALPPGRSAQGRPIEAWRSAGPAPAGGRHVYLLAGVHGDEVEGVFVLGRLLEWLRKGPGAGGGAPAEGPPLVAVPVLNVDGHAAGTRANARGVDLNRNLGSNGWRARARGPKYRPGPSPMSEPENRFLDGLFRSHPPGIVLSLHSWKPLLNYNGDCLDVALFLRGRNGYPVCKDTEGHPTPGSLGEYAPERYGAPVLTYECPVRGPGRDLEDVWSENGEGLKDLFALGALRRFVS